MKHRGKWSQPGVPHRGWTCVDVLDLGEVNHTCEMCEDTAVRYVHVMHHQDYQYHQLLCGCVCAGNMEQDLVGARRRERDFKQRQSRRRKWLTRKWRVSARGNEFLNTDGFNMVIYPRGSGWGYHLSDSDRNYASPAFKTTNEAKLALFDAMLDLKHQQT